MSDLIRGGASKPVPPGKERETPARGGEAPAAESAASATPPSPRTEPPPSNARPRASLRAVPSAPPAPRVETGAPAASPTSPERGAALPEEMFEALLQILERVRGLIGTDQPFPWSELSSVMERIVGALGQSGELFWIANNPVVPPGVDALVFHQARVGVLAVRIGVNTGLRPKQLVELGLAGCLIDVGLWLVGEGAKRFDPNTAEYRAHPRMSAELVRRWSPPSGAIADAVLQHHEVEQGQGFPQGLERDAIHPYAKILALVDRYVTLTGPGPTRALGRPHEVIRTIVRSKNEEFSPTLIKALLSEISVFPPGTPVRLNTGELGRVVGVNRNHPLRPRVEVTADAKGHALPSPKLVDLSETPFLYITGPASESA